MANPRAEFSPIFDRKPLRLPGDARIVVWVIINMEEWDINEAMARTVLPVPQGRVVIPDIPNFAWFDYGLRVGFWRLKRVLDRRNIPATISLNASLCLSYPQVVRESLDSGWELMGHGFMQRVLNVEPDEREVIRRTISTIREFSGSAPRGWMGPGLAETFDTPDILVEEGIEYVCDWCNDDQPYPMKVNSGQLISVPYTLELNDSVIFAVEKHSSSEHYDRLCHTLESIDRELEQGPRVLSLSLHHHLSGVLHRIGFVEKMLDILLARDDTVFMTGGEIVDWFVDAVPPA